ncbi:hypothetical protein [Mycolicibacterium tusciae]|uniref:hypothetical protein n=1 Tax=Mycolicibacterium tusciae TaxID=75922 RepID=UPI00024A326A|nr:hypothetical protein [Mycolicibacterium tusciae]
MADDEPMFQAPGWTASDIPAADPVRGSGAVPGGGLRDNKRLLIGAAVLAATAVVIVGVVTQLGGGDDSKVRSSPQTTYPDASGNSSSSGGRGDNPPGWGGTSTAAPHADNTITFDRMRDLVYRHYEALPEDPAATWGRIDPNLSARLGWQDYLDFWGSIASLSVVSVTPRDDTSVFVRLRYVTRRGTTDVEDRWVSFVARDGELRIFDSVRIASVG